MVGKIAKITYHFFGIVRKKYYICSTMISPCDICLEETCKGAHNCHCESCTLADKCYRKLHATIRITNRCTQECGHCCFKSSPKSNIMMTVEKAKDIAKFLKSNGIESINLMGGEFFCNPDWFEIYSALISSVKYARLVTNGDWANNLRVKTQLATLVSLFGDKIYFCISKDRWHTNKNVEVAKEFLDGTGVIVKVATEDQTTNQSIVPVGRANGQYISGIYDMMGCYCQNPENMYSFLIDEKGNIFNKDPLRPRKLLLHRKEIGKLLGASTREGYTIVPLQVYFSDGKAKLEIGLCRGKKLYDKRQDIAKRDMKREAERDFKIRNLG